MFTLEYLQYATFEANKMPQSKNCIRLFFEVIALNKIENDFCDVVQECVWFKE